MKTMPDQQKERPIVPWAPKMVAALEEQLVDYRQLANSRVIRSEEAREIVARQVRLIETLLYGEPRTALTPRHHG